MSVAERYAQELWTCQLGSISYGRALALQERLRQRRIEGELPDILLALEHPAVYTRGRRSSDAELIQDEDFYRARGIEVLPTDRGGRVTYHGPGQLVGYPIMRVGDIHSHLRAMETAIITALAALGIGARSRAAEGPDFTGVWVADRKIASIGVHVSRGVSTHGLAVNVCNDLEPFSWVTPCGLDGVQMTSIERELGSAGPSISSFRTLLADHFCRVHGRSQRAVSLAALQGSAAPEQAGVSLVGV